MKRSYLIHRLNEIGAETTAIHLHNTVAPHIQQRIDVIRSILADLVKELKSPPSKEDTAVTITMNKEQLDEVVYSMESEIDNGNCTPEQARVYAKLKDVQETIETELKKDI